MVGSCGVRVGAKRGLLLVLGSSNWGLLGVELAMGLSGRVNSHSDDKRQDLPIDCKPDLGSKIKWIGCEN